MKIGNMNFLITGGSGFVGRCLSTKLMDKYDNHNFVFIARNSKPDFPQKYFRRNTIRIVDGDIVDYGSIERYFENVDCVFHLAAKLDYGEIKSEDYIK